MDHAVGTQQEWVAARTALLHLEEEFLALRDKVAEGRRALPWVKIDKDYLFDSDRGTVTLADLFDGRKQLIVQHFMFGPDWDEGCPYCSFSADHFGGALVHLENHDISLVAVSRAPLIKIQAYHARMGWPFRWVSSFGSDFNYDFNVSFTPEQIANGTGRYNFSDEPAPMEELPGASVFIRNYAGEMFRTYSEYGRGGEDKQAANMFFDMTPLGRDLLDDDGNPIDWVRRHDRYAHQPITWTPGEPSVAAVSGGSCGCGCGS